MRTLSTALALLWPFICHLTLASLNLVMPSDEVIRLLGVNDGRGGSGGVWELAYIRDGVVNKNAAQFRIPVPEDVNAIQLVWWSGDSLQFNAGKSSRKLRVDYKIMIDVNHYQPSSRDGGESDEIASGALYQPFHNVSHTGKVPERPETFRVSLLCTGRKSATVEVLINLKFNISTYSTNTGSDTNGRSRLMEVTLTREKTCTADSGDWQTSQESRGSGNYGKSSSEDGVQPHVVFYASFLSALAAMVSTAICIVIIHIKGTFHKIVKSNGVSMSNKNTTFNTIVSASAAINQPQQLLVSKPENWDQNDCYEQVFNDGALHRRPLEYSDQGLLTMDPSAGEGLTLGPPMPPILPLPTSKKDGLLPSHLQHQNEEVFEFRRGGVDEEETELRVTDWVNNVGAGAFANLPSVPANAARLINDGSGGADSEEDDILVAQSIFQSLLIERSRLKLGSLLQEGTYGRVYEGLLLRSKNSRVRKSSDEEGESDSSLGMDEEDLEVPEEEDIMVKSVLTGTSQSQCHLLVQESVQLLWNRKSSLSQAPRVGSGSAGQNGYRHILTPIGCTWDGNSPMVIYPHPSGQGNLKQYLTKFATAGLSTHQVVRLGVQMLGALGHLHKKKIVHKDIAARNCFLGDGQNLQLGDCSLSRDLFPGDYHCLGDNENRPIKWMPIEAINSKTYSKSSDVWSFGVFLWELMTKAQQPFGDIDPFEMESYLNEGYRLHQPLNCPDQLYSVLAACWATLPHERATVQSVHTTLVWMQKQLQQFV